MVIALVMLVGGRQYYSAVFLRTYILISLADVLQPGFLASRMLFPKHSRSSSAPVEVASRWDAQIPPTNSNTVTGRYLGVRSLSTSLPGVFRLAGFCKKPSVRAGLELFADPSLSLAFIMFYICFDQMQNNLISQAGQMQTNGTPNDLLPAMNQVGCIVLGPLIQEVLYPFLHRRRIYPTAVSRIAIGFAFVTLSMLYATLVQLFIYRSPPCYDQPGSCGRNEINVWIQAPLYLLISAGEIFAYVTALEYAYDHSPKAMKVVVQAIGLLVGSVGSACAMALTPVARNPYLVTFYASLTGSMAVTTVIFWALFRRHDSSPVCVEGTADPPAALLGVTQPTNTRPAANQVSDEAPSLSPIDAGGPIELHSGSDCSSQTIRRQSQTPSWRPAIPRKSSKRQGRKADDQINFVSRAAPSTSILGLHGQCTPVPSYHFSLPPAGGRAASRGGERRPSPSCLHRYYASTIQPSV
jgi:POT family proton-dependent oligopeptide transporter